MSCTADMHKRYTMDMLPWEGKKEQVVYRGSCFPTLDPDARMQLVFVRQRLCAAYGHKDGLFNIGFPAGCQNLK